MINEKKYPIQGQKVFVGLSGGVDSAVSAALLKEEGFDVTGVFIKVWQPDFLPCNWREERRDAMRVALALDIPFLSLNFEEEYKRGVVDYMLREYEAGRTPNPDVLCNREIKFGAFWEEAKKQGANFIATGHYARVENGKLLEGRDKEKDQSYFLWTLTQDDLAHTLFPVGGLEKSEVRKLARKFSIPVSDKKDSQGICFLGDVSMEEFLSHFIKTKSGKVLDTGGEVVGSHRGALFYTMGERHGFEIQKKSASSGPFYIVAKDMERNTLTVSDRESEIKSLSPKRVVLSGVNWITEPESGEVEVRIRYRQKKVSAHLSQRDGKCVLEFKEAQKGLSLGQSAVLYKGDECLGGGVLDSVEP